MWFSSAGCNEIVLYKMALPYYEIFLRQRVSQEDKLHQGKGESKLNHATRLNLHTRHLRTASDRALSPQPSWQPYPFETGLRLNLVVTSDVCCECKLHQKSRNIKTRIAYGLLRSKFVLYEMDQATTHIADLDLL